MEKQNQKQPLLIWCTICRIKTKCMGTINLITISTSINENNDPTNELFDNLTKHLKINKNICIKVVWCNYTNPHIAIGDLSYQYEVKTEENEHDIVSGELSNFNCSDTSVFVECKDMLFCKIFVVFVLEIEKL